MIVFLIILLILVLIITSKVQINFKELYLENISKEKPKSINVVVTLKVLSIFPILKITLNNKRAEKLIYALKASAKKNMKMAKIKENLRNSKNIDKVKKHLKKFQYLCDFYLQNKKIEIYIINLPPFIFPKMYII